MALTVNELRQASHVEICYVLLIDGLQVGYTTNPDLAGSGVSSWIGTDFGDRIIKYGLILPDSISYDMDGGLIDSSGATFRLVDHDGSIAALFGTAEPPAVSYTETRLPASSSAAPATLYGYADNIPIHGKYIDIEKIGASGERHEYPCFVQDSMPGSHHAAASDQFSGSVVPVPITDDPWIMEGRKVVLYRIYRSLDLLGYTDWPGLEWQTTGGVPAAFVGTIRSTSSVDGRVWAVKCDGPESYLRKQIGRNAPADWMPVRPVFALNDADGEREDLVTVYFCKYAGATDQYILNTGYTWFDPAYAITDTQPQQIREYLNTLIQAVATDGINPFSGSSPNGLVNYNVKGIGIQIQYDAGTWSRGELILIMHHKVWRRLGWDPYWQSRPLGSQENSYHVEFTKLLQGVYEDELTNTYNIPGPGYWKGKFTTETLGSTEKGPIEASNNGQWRYFDVPTQSGTDIINLLGGQELEIGFDPIYMESQYLRSPWEYDINGTTCNANRYFLLKGRYRGDGDVEPRERVQVIKCSWVDVDGIVQPDANDLRVLHFDFYDDPKPWGIDDEIIEEDWASVIDPNGSFFILPLSSYRYHNPGTLDIAAESLLMLLQSTGTATRTGYDNGDNELTPGDNFHPATIPPFYLGTDAEIADLGLAIPVSIINWYSFYHASKQLPGGWQGPLSKGVIGWSGMIQAEDLIKEVCEGRGWELGFAGGKFTLYSKYSTADANEYVAHISGASLHGDMKSPGMVPQVSIQAVDPVDKWTYQSGRHPETGDYVDTRNLRSLDEGAPYRQGKVEANIKGWGVIPPLLGNEGLYNELTTLFSQQASKWRAKPHLHVTVDVQRRVGQDLYPGDVVTLTNDWPPDLEGGYGLTSRVARVISAKHHLDSGHVSLGLRVEGVAASNRRFGPIAKVLDDVATVEERYDSATYTFYCYEDAWGHGDADTWSDVAWFAEPAWSDYGGSMLVYGWQYDGRDWSPNFSFSVASVDTANHTITASGAITGTFYERMYTVLVPAPYDSQTADWVKTLLSVVTQSNGKFGAGPTQGWKLLP